MKPIYKLQTTIISLIELNKLRPQVLLLQNKLTVETVNYRDKIFILLTLERESMREQPL